MVFMTRTDAKDYVGRQEPDFLEQARSRANGYPTYICPACGNGSGREGTGIALIPGTEDHRRYKCFVCDLCEDNVGLYKIANSITDDREAFEGIYSYYGLTVENAHAPSKPAAAPKAAAAPVTIPKTAAAPAEISSSAPDRLEETDYLKRRGISIETARRFGLRYDPEWRHPNVSMAVPASPRIIVPVQGGNYMARDTRDRLSPEQERYKKSKYKANEEAGWTFNTGALTNTVKNVIFVTEGEFDAMSIIEAGGEAVALGSLANGRYLLDQLKKTPTSKPLAIALDNEADPEKAARVSKAAAELKAGIEALGCKAVIVPPGEIAGSCKDANERLVSDRRGLVESVARVTANITAMISAESAAESAAEKDAELNEYRAVTAGRRVSGLIENIKAFKSKPCIPTGLSDVDRQLDGGLYEGLYVIGALSSLGKTTFVMQAADNIADDGTDVLIFSLEMSAEELIGKSISRETARYCLKNSVDMKNAKTVRGITDGGRYKFYKEEEKKVIREAFRAYNRYSGRIYLIEGSGDITCGTVREAVERHIRLTGRRPVVVVDYLQILASPDVHFTEKQATDRNVTELKRISRDFGIPVIAISSLNRASYKEAVSMSSFKESGGIEYGTDVLIGMHFKGAGETGFDVEKAKSAVPRLIELVVLKNRSGPVGVKVDLKFYAMFNYFYDNLAVCHHTSCKRLYTYQDAASRICP